MRVLGTLGVVMALSLMGCMRPQAPTVLKAQPLEPNTKVVMLDYYRRDAPLGVGQLSFEVSSSDPKVQVARVEYKHGTAPRPRSRANSTSLVIAQDQSASLSETDPERLRYPAVRALIESLPNDARVGYLCFASLNFMRYGDFDLLVPLSANNKGALLQAVERLARNDFSMHGTPLWNTLWGAVALLEQEPQGLRQVLCFTDGQNETPDDVPNRTPDEVIQRAVRAQVSLSFLVLGDETTIPTYHETVGTLERMAQATGGSVITVREANDLNRAFTEAGQALGREPCYRLHCQIVRTGGYPDNRPIRLRVRALPNGIERTYEFYPETGEVKAL